MRPSFGYAEEEQLGKPYDLKMLRRLYPFTRPYRRLLSGAIILITLITLVNLSVPYLTKIAIDQYIVPQMESGHTQAGDGQATRYLKADMSDPRVRQIVAVYPGQFRTEGGLAMIAFDNLSNLEKKHLRILRKRDLEGVVLVVILFLAIILLDFCLSFLQTLIMEYTGQKIMHDLRVRLFSHVQSLSAAFFTQNPVGRLVTRVTNDVQNMHEMFTSVIAVLFKDLFLLTGITIVLLVIHWKLALISFTLPPLILYASAHFSKQSREMFRLLRVKVAEINTRFSETIGGIRVVQLFLQEKQNYENFKTLNHENYEAALRQVRILSAFLRIMAFLGVFASAVVIFYGGNKVLGGSMSLGTLVAFISYMKMFFSPIQDIAQKYNTLQNAMASAERIFLILDNEERLPRPEAQGNDDAKAQPRPSVGKIREIVMQDVSFAYVPDEMVLKGVSFAVRAGETVAVVGPTGSGKTSLINLMTRFYMPTSGEILINGKDMREWAVSDLRAGMALVTQDPFLFSGTIEENILRGVDASARPRHEVSEKEMDAILRASNCKSLVDRLPKGIHTELSEGGASISSGERQLISIARAFARDPSLIILDEATSYIDSETEVRIQEALLNLMRNRTSVIVAHRLSTTRHADRIIVLKKGEITETGTHEELMRQKGFYFKLNQLQS